MLNFVAIDFETADNGRDSACSVALVIVKDGRVAGSVQRLIRPPRRRMMFTHIHGISYAQVADQPDFAGIWPELADVIAEADFLAAHNAPFDKGVLEGCCAAHGLPAPRKHFLCTVRLAREVWNLHPTKLPDVCRHLGLSLNHHDALSDATACANIVLAAVKTGWTPDRHVRA